MKTTHYPLAAALLMTLSCSDGTTAPTTTTTAAAPAPAAPAKVASVEETVPTEPFTKGQAAFNQVRDELLKSYYADGMTEDDVYRAATAGMLERLEPRMSKYNTLLSPRDVAEMKSDLKGELVGVGVRINFDPKSGYADVIGTIPGSASERVGMLAGDKIVSVNGKLYKGMTIGDVVTDIRGKENTSLQMTVLRGDKLIPFTLTRTKIQYDQPTVSLYADGLGYVRIPSFTEKTAGVIKSGLDDVMKQGPKAIVVDLRHNQGGLFESALSVANLLVPAGAPIVSVKKKGTADEMHTSKGPSAIGDLPVAVLVDEMTASGAELLASALRDDRHAKLVGAKTFGKWSVQQLEDLPNGYAYKYTLGLFKSPSGQNYEGVGLAPDVDVAMDETAFARSNSVKPEDRLAADVQLRTAKELLLKTP